MTFANAPNNNFMKRILYVLSFIPLILLILTFGIHAWWGISGKQELIQIVSVLGFDEFTTRILLYLAGLHDAAVAVLLLINSWLIPKRYWKFIYVWAAIWPIVPRVLIWMGGSPFEWVEVVIFATLSIVAALTHHWRISQKE